MYMPFCSLTLDLVFWYFWRGILDCSHLSFSSSPFALLRFCRYSATFSHQWKILNDLILSARRPPSRCPRQPQIPPRRTHLHHLRLRHSSRHCSSRLRHQLLVFCSLFILYFSNSDIFNFEYPLFCSNFLNSFFGLNLLVLCIYSAMKNRFG